MLAGLGMLASVSVAQPPGGVPPGGPMAKANTASIQRKWLDVAYADKSTAQKLDIYLPDTGKGPFPVIVPIHGGAFKMGDKADGQLTPMLAGLKRGYAVVSVNYRLSGEAVFPAQIQDVKAAIRFIRAHASTYQLNPNRIAAWGGSAGGHLAAMAGTTSDITDFDDASLGNAGQSSRVQAVVDWFGPIRFDQMDAQFKASGKGTADHDAANSPESQLLGKPVQQAPDLVKRASPATYISQSDPPMFIEHGTDDRLVPTQQSVDFAAALEKILGHQNVTITLLEGANHGGPQFNTPENLATVFSFLDACLK
ncbi:alpha/beta hydrolase [Spirosoma utsteinense]|uniref:Acetyl esterase/lipase n=1 Tax=Spirosoma utsteinense TaxID=2585773 RepID=A0ABR6W9J9_9BACT|nr:alpha/beta hydrolase [Spirosoma utsteinense]MBC3787654.1 acetyl esterase/lipase [Spirosoma utsteinense]MBC3793250.1 acetyl esterase/lipase [Spirosoma utsteinense]